jgi:urease accessory protein
MDSRLRGQGAASADVRAASDSLGLTPWRDDASTTVSDPQGLTPLSRLLTWLSPAYPVGGFSYSHGLEWEVEAGRVKNAASLGAWIGDVLAHGAGRTDAIFLAAAWRAVSDDNERVLKEVAEFAAAFTASAERRLETLAQGAAFMTATRAAWPHPKLDGLFDAAAEIAYPVAVGACAAVHGLPPADTAQAFVQAFAANIVSAGVRLIPLGQTDGLRVIARLEPLIPTIVADALRADLDDIGGIAAMADIASMRHETQYTRLFRS